MVEQSEVHGRHPRKEGDLVALHDLERFLGTEARQQAEASAVSDERVLDAGLSERMEEGQGGKRHVVSAGRDQLRNHDGAVEHQVRVGEFGAFGFPGGARGVENHGRVGRIGRMQRRDRLCHRHLSQGISAFGRGGHHRNSRRSGTLPGRRLEQRVRHQQLCTRILQVVGHFRSREQHVERHHGAARVQDAEVGDTEVRKVWNHQRNLVARRDAAFEQGRGDAAGGPVELAERQRVLIETDDDLVGTRVGARLENAAQIHVHGMCSVSLESDR